MNHTSQGNTSEEDLQNARRASLESRQGIRRPPTPVANPNPHLSVNIRATVPSLAERLTSPSAPTTERPIRPLPRRAFCPAPDWLTPERARQQGLDTNAPIASGRTVYIPNDQWLRREAGIPSSDEEVQVSALPLGPQSMEFQTLVPNNTPRGPEVNTQSNSNSSEGSYFVPPPMTAPVIPTDNDLGGETHSLSPDSLPDPEPDDDDIPSLSPLETRDVPFSENPLADYLVAATQLPDAIPSNIISLDRVLPYLEGNASSAAIHPPIPIFIRTNPTIFHRRLTTVHPRHLRRAVPVFPSQAELEGWTDVTHDYITTREDVTTEVLWAQLKAIGDEALLEEVERYRILYARRALLEAAQRQILLDLGLVDSAILDIKHCLQQANLPRRLEQQDFTPIHPGSGYPRRYLHYCVTCDTDGHFA